MPAGFRRTRPSAAPWAVMFALALVGPTGACADASSGNATSNPPRRTTTPAAPVDELVQGSVHEITSPNGRPLQLSLEAASRRFVLGQNVLIDYVLANEGREPVTIEWGGDYRGSTRHLRYHVQVIAEDGTRARDPNPSTFSMGGLGGEQTVAPDGRWVHSLPLPRYAHIERPGRYRIRIFHDLGWPMPHGADPHEPAPIPDDDPRWAELSLEFSMPTTTEAQQLVEQMRALPKDPGSSVGERTPPYPDFAALNALPYLPVLRQLIEQEEAAELMAGLAAMPYPEATAAILDLTVHSKREVADAALNALIGRLPRPTGPNARPPFVPADFSREFLSRRAWGPRFEVSARSLGLQLIVHADPARAQIGAQIMESIGRPADFVALVSALDRALDDSQANGATKNYPHPATAHGELIGVLEKMIAQGVTVDATPRSAGMIAAYLIRWGADASRPSDYAEQAAGWMRHPIPTVRELTVARTEDPLPDVMADELPGLLESGELSLQVTACDAITALSQARFADPVLAVARTAKDEWLIRAAEAAAIASGVPRSTIVGIWASRLDEPGAGWPMLQQLITVIDQRGYNGHGIHPSAEEAKRLKREWTAVIAAHAKTLDAGMLFSLEGPEFTPALLPEGRRLSPPPAAQ